MFAIYIQDTGLGMTDEQMLESCSHPRLTVSLKFWQVKRVQTGLTLCKRFVDLNHGEISVETEEGRGNHL